MLDDRQEIVMSKGVHLKKRQSSLLELAVARLVRLVKNVGAVGARPSLPWGHDGGSVVAICVPFVYTGGGTGA